MAAPVRNSGALRGAGPGDRLGRQMIDAALSSGSLPAIWQRFGRPVVSAVATSAAGLVFIQLIVLVVWGTDTGSSAGPDDASRVGAALWLLAHGASLDLPSGRVNFLPFGLALLPLLAATTAGHRRAAGRLDRLPPARGLRPRGLRPASSPGSETPPPWGAVLGDVALVAGVQTTFVLVIALIVSTPTTQPDLLTVIGGALAFSLPGATIGVLSGYGALRSTWRSLPAPVRVPATAALTAVTSMLAAVAFGVAMVLAATLPEIASVDRGLGAGVVGGVGLAVIQLAILPNLVLWALAYTLGPGFATGGGFVRVNEVQATTLSDLPVFAALPPGPLPRPGWLVLAVVPVIAGTMLAVSVRRGTIGKSHRDRLGSTLVAAAATGLLLMIVMYLSGGEPSGAAGHFGPTGWLVGLAAAGELAVVAVVVCSLAELAARRAGQPFEAGSVRNASLKRRLQSSRAAAERASR